MILRDKSLIYLILLIMTVIIGGFLYLAVIDLSIYFMGTVAIISILLAFFFAEKIKAYQVIIFYPVIFLVVFFAASILAGIYNGSFGHSCNVDADCKFVCGEGAINNRYVSVGQFGGDCFVNHYSLCENKRCESFANEHTSSAKVPSSTRDCNRITDTELKEECYAYLAVETRNISLCQNSGTFEKSCVYSFQKG